MKKIKIVVLSTLIVAVVIVGSGFTKCTSLNEKQIATSLKKKNQTINMFVTHGHCNTPFMGSVDNLKLELVPREDLGNPLEGMRLSFDIDPNTFNVCAGEELTEKIKTPGLFISKNKEQMTFRTTDVFTMGLDWYQINGKLSIKGVERSVKLFATGIRNPKESNSTSLILEGQINLLDWGIDYNKIVNGKSDNIATKWMHFNMRIDLS